MIDWSASNPPYIHEGSGTWLPRPEGNWWNWDGSGWGLMAGPGGDHIQSGGDIAPTEWWTGEWRVPYTLTKREWPYSIMDFDTEHYYNCTSLRRSTCKMVW